MYNLIVFSRIHYVGLVLDSPCLSGCSTHVSEQCCQIVGFCLTPSHLSPVRASETKDRHLATLYQRDQRRGIWHVVKNTKHPD